jgi:hypothetical protein
MGLRMRGGDGVAAIRELEQRVDRPRLLVLPASGTMSRLPVIPVPDGFRFQPVDAGERLRRGRQDAPQQRRQSHNSVCEF